MKVRILVLVVLCLACLGIPSVSSGQERQGFYFGIGGGYGSAGISCTDCADPGREGSGVAYLKGGWTLNPRVLVGGEFNFWSKETQLEPGITAAFNMYNVSATVTFYPQPRGGFFVKGGAGVAFTDMDVSAAGSSMTADLGRGLGLIVGAGYDIPIHRRVSLTPTVNFWHGQPGDLKVMGETIFRGFKQNVVEFSIGLTFQ